MEKRKQKYLKLPEHLCESENPNLKAKAYTLQLLLLAQHVGGEEVCSKLEEWLKVLDLQKLKSVVKKYEKNQRVAETHFPFIRSDLRNCIKELDSGYNAGGSFVNSNAVDSIEVDGFLFEELEEALQESGCLSDRLCQNCMSSNTVERPIKFYSNSKETLVNLYGVVLANGKFNHIVILGSGDGSLVYGAFFFTTAIRVTSYVDDSNFQKFQENICKKHCMASRVTVKLLKEFLNDDFLSGIDMLICGDEPVLEGEDGNLFQERLNNYVAMENKLLVCRSTSDIESRLPVSLTKHEHLFSTQEYSLYTSQQSRN